MAIRIKSHWNNEEAERSPLEIASALAYIMLIVIIGISNVYIWYLNRMKES